MQSTLINLTEITPRQIFCSYAPKITLFCNCKLKLISYPTTFTLSSNAQTVTNDKLTDLCLFSVHFLYQCSKRNSFARCLHMKPWLSYHTPQYLALVTSSRRYGTYLHCVHVLQQASEHEHGRHVNISQWRSPNDVDKFHNNRRSFTQCSTVLCWQNAYKL